MSDSAANKELVIQALTELFIQKDASAIDRYWGDPYIQHNPRAPNGREALRGLVSGAEFGYQLGTVVADGDIVMVHGRYEGLAPQPTIAVDIFRIESGKLVEHWDVAQKEITDSVSGNAMFTAAGSEVATG